MVGDKEGTIVGISDCAMKYCTCTPKIILPKTLKYIGYDSFSDCNFKHINLPQSLERIKDGAFSKCRHLETINIPEKMKRIDEFVFAACVNLNNVTIGEGIKSIGSYAFYRCRSLEHITIPNSVTSIESDAFHGCSNLKKVIFNNSRKNIRISKTAFPGKTELVFLK